MFSLTLLLFGLTAPVPATPLTQPRFAALAPAAHAQPLLPDFTLEGIDGKLHRLSQFRGRPVALFFFCGCPWCRRCAETWGKFQRGGALLPAPETAPALPPVTLVVFSGDAPAARAFAAETGLDPAQTILLTDPTQRVTQTLYHANPCPRVFVLDGQGRQRYTNNHQDDNARQASAIAIASRALDALRTSAAPSPKPSVPKPSPKSSAAAAPPGLAPDFTVQDGAGRSVRLSDLRGKMVLLDFWAIGCAACRPALEAAVQQARRYPQKVVVLAVDEWDTPEAFRAWLHFRPQPPGLTITPGLILAVDATHEAGQQYHVLPLPDEYVLDQQGRVRAHWVSDVNSKALAASLQKLVTRRYTMRANKIKASNPKVSALR